MILLQLYLNWKYSKQMDKCICGLSRTKGLSIADIFLIASSAFTYQPTYQPVSMPNVIKETCNYTVLLSYKFRILSDISVILHHVENNYLLCDPFFIGLWKKCASATVCQFSRLQY